MDFLYYLSPWLLIATIIIGITGLIRPSRLTKYLGARANRKFILGASLGLFLIFSIVLTVTEPDHIKQARLEREQAALVTTTPIPPADDTNIAGATDENQAPATNPRDYWHEVISVTDGDTIKVRVDGKEEKIRIIGIDSPEATTSTECFGTEASAKARELLTDGWVQLETDPSQSNRDRYNRLLRFVWLSDGRDFGRTMIDTGYAFEYTYSLPYTYQAAYQTAETTAKQDARGLWAADSCNGQRAIPQPAVTAAPAPAPQSTPPPAPAPAPAPTPPPAPTPQPTPTGNCDPNYTPCVPLVSYDLNCPDIGFRVTVIGSDPHRFDRDNDGYGCESY